LSLAAACKLKNKYKGDGIAIEENGGLLDDGLSITRDSGWYVMDDFTTCAAATVPEPGTQLMLGSACWRWWPGGAHLRSEDRGYPGLHILLLSSVAGSRSRLRGSLGLPFFGSAQHGCTRAAASRAAIRR